MHVFNLSTPEAESDRPLWVWGPPGPQSEFQEGYDSEWGQVQALRRMNTTAVWEAILNKITLYCRGKAEGRDPRSPKLAFSSFKLSFYWFFVSFISCFLIPFITALLRLWLKAGSALPKGTGSKVAAVWGYGGGISPPTCAAILQTRSKARFFKLKFSGPVHPSIGQLYCAAQAR